MVAEGRGEELLSIAVGATPGIFSARTHLDKYGRDDRNDCRPYAKRIGCPLLAIERAYAARTGCAMKNIYDSRFSRVCSRHSKITQNHPHKDAMKLFFSLLAVLLR